MKKNSLPVTIKLHVKVGDTVKVIAGHDKGKVSTVLRLYTHNSKIVLKDVNLKTKHVKGKAEGETGQIVQVSLSNFCQDHKSYRVTKWNFVFQELVSYDFPLVVLHSLLIIYFHL